LTEQRDPVARAEQIVGHSFARPELLREALTHRSAAYDRRTRGRPGGLVSNERLEFIGDRVLGLLLAEWLAERFPREQEGQLGPRHGYLVSRPVLAGIGEELGLSEIVAVAPNEARAGVKRLSTVVADTMEALIGAMYLDAGLDAPRRFVRAAWGNSVEAHTKPPKDPKTRLQEWALARGRELPTYEVSGRSGPPHAPNFTISVTVAGQTGSATAGTKREGERAAAEDLLGKLRR
jgi:ribonuclease-3